MYPFLEYVPESGAPCPYVIDRLPFAIGSTPESDLLLPHPEVRSRHGLIVKSESGYALREVGESGRRTRLASLRDGDAVSFGPYRFRFRDPGRPVDLPLVCSEEPLESTGGGLRKGGQVLGGNTASIPEGWWRSVESQWMNRWWDALRRCASSTHGLLRGTLGAGKATGDLPSGSMGANGGRALLLLGLLALIAGGASGVGVRRHETEKQTQTTLAPGVGARSNGDKRGRVEALGTSPEAPSSQEPLERIRHMIATGDYTGAYALFDLEIPPESPSFVPARQLLAEHAVALAAALEHEMATARPEGRPNAEALGALVRRLVPRDAGAASPVPIEPSSSSDPIDQAYRCADRYGASSPGRAAQCLERVLKSGRLTGAAPGSRDQRMAQRLFRLERDLGLAAYRAERLEEASRRLVVARRLNPGDSDIEGALSDLDANIAGGLYGRACQMLRQEPGEEVRASALQILQRAKAIAPPLEPYRYYHPVRRLLSTLSARAGAGSSAAWREIACMQCSKGL